MSNHIRRPCSFWWGGSYCDWIVGTGPCICYRLVPYRLPAVLITVKRVCTFLNIAFVPANVSSLLLRENSIGDIGAVLSPSLECGQCLDALPTAKTSRSATMYEHRFIHFASYTLLRASQYCHVQQVQQGYTVNACRVICTLNIHCYPTFWNHINFGVYLTADFGPTLSPPNLHQQWHHITYANNL